MGSGQRTADSRQWADGSRWRVDVLRREKDQGDRLIRDSCKVYKNFVLLLRSSNDYSCISKLPDNIAVI